MRFTPLRFASSSLRTTRDGRALALRRWTRVGPVVAMLVAVIAVVAWTPRTAAADSTATATTGPKLTVAEPLHDFGTTPQGQALTHEFRLTNTGDQVLHISQVTPACGCTTTGDWPRELKPGESGVIPIRLDTSHFAGPITKTVTVKSDDGARPTTVIEMKATIWTPVNIASPVLIFQAVTDPKQSSTRSTTIRNEIEGTMTLSEPHSDNPVFKPTLKETVPGKEYELTVTTVAPLPDGTQTARITMRSSLPKVPEVTVQAVVTVLPAIQVAPSEIMFSVQQLAAPEKRYAVVLNHRGYDLQLSDLSTTAAGVTLTPNVSADRKQFTIALTFPAGFSIHPGEKYVLRGKTNHPSVPSFEIPIVYAGDR